MNLDVRARVGWLVERADAGVLALRDQLSPGQRWTAALTVGLVVVVLTFGLPSNVVVAPGPVLGGARPAGASDGGGGPSTGAPVAAPPSSSGQSVPPATGSVAARVGPASGDGAGVAPPSRQAGPSPAPVPVPAVVALVRSGGGLPDRDDAAVAETFLDRAGFPSTTVVYDEARPTLCDEVAAAGNVVVMSTGPDPELRRCLVDRGLVLVAFDAGGDEPASVVSTRRGVRDSLSDLGAWGAGGDGALRGRVGVVAAADLRADVEPALLSWQRLGVDVAATAFLGDGPTEVPDAVRRFASAGVQVVVFAVPTDVQRRWLAQEAVLSPGVRHVVSDVFGLGDEVYPVTFDGALAHTSLRLPWFARQHGESPEQAECRETWEGAGARTMLTSEAVPVYTWCLHAGLVSAALRLVPTRPADGFATLLRSLSVASPLTSDLAPLPDDGWGPTRDAELTWQAACRCWRSTAPFADRPAG